ncbi:O-antigen ligase family protein [Methyloversatilis sp.]|uniref:O-antigen ligase family protein n=1 Tax=Methyloversatilis sp. TaxID=2569862 RepID=UPI003F6E8BD4
MTAVSSPRILCANVRLIVQVLVCLFAGFHVFVLTKPEYPQSWYDHQRLMQLACITLSVAILPFLTSSVARQLFRALVCISVVLLAVLLAHGVHGRPVIIESLTLALLIITAVWWSGLIRTLELGDALLLAAQLSIAWYAAISILWLVLSVSNGLLPDPFAFFDGFVNPRLFGAWVTLSWPLLLLRPRLLKNVPPTLAKFLIFLLFSLAAVWWSLAFFSGTRATWLAAAVMLALTALCSPVSRRIALHGVLVIAAGYLLQQLLFVKMPLWMTGVEVSDALDRLREGASLSNRDVLWRAAWQGIVERPWLGAGPMMFSATNNGVASTTHNIVLQLAYEWGVPFTLLVIAATVCTLWKQFQRCRIDASPASVQTRLVLWMCIVGGLIEAQLDGLLCAPHSQLLFVVLVAWLVSLDESPPVRLTAIQENQWKVLRFAPLVMMLILWWAIWPELSNLEPWETETLDLTGVGHFQPRFWLQGVIFPPP